MKKVFLQSAIILFILISGVCFSQSVQFPIEQKLLPADIANKSIHKLWVMRNSIFAKYGRTFKTYELHTYFMKQSWYKVNENFDAKQLSRQDLQNIDLILAREKKLRKKDIDPKNERINVNNVYNIFQYPAFSKTEKEKLSKNGFIVLPTDKNQLFHIYERNDYLGIPSFITVDAVLQLYHLYFDMTLRNIESKYLAEKLKILCRRVLEETDKLYRETDNDCLKKAIDSSLVYFSIPYYFIHGDTFSIRQELKSLALTEIGRCEKHQGWAPSPLLKRVFDYSQYVPRGHYTRSEKLKKYFMAMMWLGHAGIPLTRETGILQSILFTHILYNSTYENQPLYKLWKDIYEPTVFYVGVSDDPGPEDFKILMDLYFGKTPAISDYVQSEILTKIVDNLSEGKISGHGQWGKQEKQFRAMGQRFIPDSYIFHRLTNMKRMKPMGLDVMAAFGNRQAKELMLNTYKSSWEKFPAYPQIMDSLIAENDSLTKADWTKNLYYYWLYNLQALYQIKDTAQLPFFMKTEGWGRKTLNTWLGSWAELRHNTILYAKQSVAAECGGESNKIKAWIPEPPKGYVEPNTEFYSRLMALMKFTKKGLLERGMIDRRMSSLSTRFIDLLDFLNRIAQKELKGQRITLKEYEQIQKVGSLLDNLTLSVLIDNFATWDRIDGPDKNMPVIADVHTADFEALEVGVGKAHEIYVIVNIEGKLKLTRGAIFSYYEFWWPISDRLTDETWQEMLRLRREPLQPDWTELYKSDEYRPKKLKPLYLPPHYIPKSSTKPGWKIIRYDTGC